MKFGSRGESHRYEFGRFGYDFIGLRFRYAFDGQQVFFGSERNGLYRVISTFFQFLHVSRSDAVSLQHTGLVLR